MKKTRFILVMVVCIYALLLMGCWNYKEVEDLSIAAGAAIDKDGDEYIVTAEVIEIPSGKEQGMKSKIIESRGKTIFDAIRNTVQISGKKLYWTHAKILIISQDLAKEGAAKAFDFFFRDSELRSNLYVVISKEKTAKEIYNSETTTEEIKAFEMYQTIQNADSTAKSIPISLYEVINDMIAEGKSAITPAVQIITNDENKRILILNTAVFKKDKLVGFLDEQDTKFLHYIIDIDKGGLLVDDELTMGKDLGLTFEVSSFGTKTKIKPEYKNNNIEMNIEVNISAAIAENMYHIDLSSTDVVDEIKKEVESTIEGKLKALIKKVQIEYGSDIFGFGNRVKSDMPNVWKEIKGNWDEIFKSLKVNLNVNITITNKAVVAKPLEIGD